MNTSHEPEPGDPDAANPSTPAPLGAPLADLRVIDLATVLAGPSAARYLADFGADVIKVERPDGGDTTRAMGWRDPDDGVTMFWKLAGRNKRTIALDLKADEERDVFLRLCDSADVLVENFRPGTLERLGLGPDVLLARNPKLVILRVTGFGQDGPYKDRPGFASIAEAMSGLVAISGEPDGNPLLPPIALTDEVTGVVGAFAAMVALHSGVGQVVDVSLFESLFQLMGPLVTAWLKLGYLQPRMGAEIPYSVPRNTYRCADGAWVGISSTAESVARRVMAIIGLDGDDRFATFTGRVAHREIIDERLGAWIAARPMAEVIATFNDAQAAIAPVMTMQDLASDEHVLARQMIADVDGYPMQGLIARLSATPGRVRWVGRDLDADRAEILAELTPELDAGHGSGGVSSDGER
ncbi:MAG: CaiB/BaiF CoA transferase family protein [Acidimicrobiia bacterium]